MAVALRIVKVGTPSVEIDFEEYEVTKVSVRPYHPSRVDRAQTGKPTLFIFGSSKVTVTIDFRIHGDTTSAKLTTIRNAAKTTGQQFQVYPKYIDDNSAYYDCVVSPLIPINWLISGMYSAGEIYQLAFQEA
jgi:hypothetical protein